VKLVRALAIFMVACYGALAFAPPSCAQAYVVNLDPAQTKITFTLDTTLHDVHGTFQLKSGQIHFDKASSKASGAIIVDAQSGDTDNKSRDKKMHQEILESPKYPEIVFTPQQVRVLMMLSQGLLNKQIAYELGVSEATVKAHVSAILQKLGVESRTQAVIAAGKIEAGQWPQVPVKES